MTIKFGIHAGPQDLSIAELKKLWRIADNNDFDWASVWDHFYANPLESRDHPCFEGVASMAALAALTRNVSVGCLVFCALFRNPGILAKSAVTIDHLSNGRAQIGIGAGWFEEEFREFGYGFPSLGTRMDQLEEALTIFRALIHEEVVDFKGKYYEIKGAVCSPKPVNPNMPIWVGGRGKDRTPLMAAKYADGFNMPYLPPGSVKERLDRLHQACETIDRNPADLDTSVNLGFYMDSPSSKARAPEVGASGSLVGGVDQTIDRIGEYIDTGIKGINIAFRPPIDWEALQCYVEDVMPNFKTY